MLKLIGTTWSRSERTTTMSDSELARERRALLALELAAMGADVRRLGFVAWLVSHKQDPEWYGRGEPRRRRRPLAPASTQLRLAA